MGAVLAGLGQHVVCSWCPPGVGPPARGRPPAGRRPGRPPAGGRRSWSSSCSVTGSSLSRLLMSGTPPRPFAARSRSFSRARCSRMLAAFAVMSRTVAISPGASCSHAHRRSSSASSVAERVQRLGEGVVALARPGRRLGGRVHDRDLARPAAAAGARSARRWPGSCGPRRTPTAAPRRARRRAGASRPAASRRARRRPSPGRYAARGSAAAARSASAPAPRNGPVARRWTRSSRNHMSGPTLHLSPGSWNGRVPMRVDRGGYGHTGARG